MNRFASFISRRLSLGSEESSRWSPSVVVAVAGVALSFVVMLAAIAIVTGFKREITRKVFDFNPLIAISPVSAADLSASDSEALLASWGIGADMLPPDAEVSLAVSLPALIRSGEEFMGVVFRGFSEGYDWQPLAAALRAGSLPFENVDDGSQVVISSEMSSHLALEPGSRFDVTFFIDGVPRQRRFTVAGVYCSDFAEHDHVVAYAPFATLRNLARRSSLPDASLQINGLQPSQIQPLTESLQRRFNAGFIGGRIASVPAVTSVYASAAMFFNWLAMLDTNIVVILVLMACVSAFMLISSVMTLILRRVAMIGQLKALGASNSQLRAVFARLGLRITLAGLAIGNLVGLGLLAAQQQWHFLPLDPQNYYISFVPVNLSAPVVVFLNIAVFGMAFAIMLLPTGIIARMSPSATLRFE